MELYQLRSFTTIAEVGNFTHAAKALATTQPTLSQQIINLEKELGQRLFHRLGRRAVLTEAGQVFLDRTRRILFEVDSARQEIADHPGMDRRITVGAVPSVAPYMLPPLIAQARIEHPNLDIHIREDFHPALVQAVLEGELDLAIVSGPVHESALAVEPYIREPLLLVVGEQHPFATREKILTADLAAETFVMLGSSSLLAEQVRSFCGDHRFTPRIGYRCAQVATVKTLVALGVGISILPRSSQSSKDLDTLVYRKLSDSSPERELQIIRHQQRYQSRGAAQFLGMLKAGVMQPVTH
ncbi:MAG: LysR family transcriptional regulator [Opitutaceae bacterium]|nr:LysR family transcriptional regulator [Opitutaceae bacterium]